MSERASEGAAVAVYDDGYNFSVGMSPKNQRKLKKSKFKKPDGAKSRNRMCSFRSRKVRLKSAYADRNAIMECIASKFELILQIAPT